jgi:hypothetical protein
LEKVQWPLWQPSQKPEPQGTEVDVEELASL